MDVNAVFNTYYKTPILSGRLRQEAEQYNQEWEKLKATKEGKKQQPDFVKSHRKLLDEQQAAMRQDVLGDIWEATMKRARELGYTAVIDRSGNFKDYFWAENGGTRVRVKNPKPIKTKAPDITSDVIGMLNANPVAVPP